MLASHLQSSNFGFNCISRVISGDYFCVSLIMTSLNKRNKIICVNNRIVPKTSKNAESCKNTYSVWAFALPFPKHFMQIFSGPSCQTVVKMKEMISSGMNIARLNFSHGSYEVWNAFPSSQKFWERTTVWSQINNTASGVPRCVKKTYNLLIKWIQNRNGVVASLHEFFSITEKQ